jgi:hypothetical protein
VLGLLVGPRGNSLKKMEKESGAKISIRGKGSVKEGKSRPDLSSDNIEEDLHCLVTADYEENVAACVKMINHVIETVRTLALVNGFTSTRSLGRVHSRRTKRSQASSIKGTSCSQRNPSRRRKSILSKLWRIGTPKVRLPRAQKIPYLYHLPLVWRSWPHGTRLFGQQKFYILRGNRILFIIKNSSWRFQH